MCPPEACVLQVNGALWCQPKEAQNPFFQTFTLSLFQAGGMTFLTQPELLSLQPNG